ncbi:hypothetical protein CCACVL1_03640 [Corchorus capsularis]|uniref:DM2 domain-containing protein n=1 Tax=Corchorus capsularis TaxID=210143 RepID=A0A1R3JYH8_COCAP|nr:hypothetical protein CCACVL1_03640 [Corchorus capsularis]
MSSVFKGFKALLASPAAATPSSGMAAVASKTPKKAASPKPKASKPAAPRTTGINKVTPVSPALGQFLGTQQASRAEAVKQIWTYIKSHNLQNPTNKREIFCDGKLKTIFDGKEKIGFLEIGKLLTRHFVKTN